MVGECERVRGTIYLTEILKLHLSEILLMQALRLRKKKKELERDRERESERDFLKNVSDIAVILLVVLLI